MCLRLTADGGIPPCGLYYLKALVSIRSSSIVHFIVVVFSPYGRKNDYRKKDATTLPKANRSVRSSAEFCYVKVLVLGRNSFVEKAA